ncbi:MAG: hypothetical protein E6G17_12160 [Actinobacteria bacterium]|nr:MAG: hypothetical protein E6G17_12160 [Actinomycetota bacterium]
MGIFSRPVAGSHHGSVVAAGDDAGAEGLAGPPVVVAAGADAAAHRAVGGPDARPAAALCAPTGAACRPGGRLAGRRSRAVGAGGEAGVGCLGRLAGQEDGDQHDRRHREHERLVAAESLRDVPERDVAE